MEISFDGGGNLPQIMRRVGHPAIEKIPNILNSSMMDQ